MNLDRVASGDNIPNEINVVVEIPAHSDPVKYELDKDTGAMFVDRFMSTAMHYPCNYGYIPHTLCGDGDPTDVMVVMPVPINYGAVITCRPVGLLLMEDESGEDAKVLAVPTDDVTGLYHDVRELEDVDVLLRRADLPAALEGVEREITRLRPAVRARLREATAESPPEPGCPRSSFRGSRPSPWSASPRPGTQSRTSPSCRRRRRRRPEPGT